MALMVLFFSSCTITNYLPQASKIPEYPYGAYIKIVTKAGDKNLRNKGELISAGDEKIVLLDKKDNHCIEIPVDSILRFKLYYAKSDHVYWWTIPALAALSATHGYFGILTIPANLIVTSSVYASSQLGFQYTEKNLPIISLYMYARYPQGIPSNVDIKSIK